MRDQLRLTLDHYAPQLVTPDEALWPAAVLVLIYECDGRPHIVFQKRTDRVDAHKGEVSLPGGGADAGDTDLIFTALRETHEEIGVEPHDVEVLGQIDQIRTISNFIVTPYVGWLRRFPYEWRFSEHEVAYLLEVPIDHLLDPKNFVPDCRMIDGREVIVPSYRFEEDLIWGATGRMISNFLDIWTAARA